MEREPKECDIASIASNLFAEGMSVEEVVQTLRPFGFLINPTPDKKGVSVSLEPYDGALHPRTTIVRQSPSLLDFTSDPE